MAQDRQEIPGQVELAEKPRELRLIKIAQSEGVLSPITRVLFSEKEKLSINPPTLSVKKDMHGIRLTGSWPQGEDAVTLVPFGLQLIPESPHSNADQEWHLFFTPLLRNETAILIPDFRQIKDTVGVNVALPIKEWPQDKLVEVLDIIANSRRTLIYPNVHSTSGNHPYDPKSDIWFASLHGRRDKLPEVVRRIEQTRSDNQIRYANQFQGT